MRKYVQQLQHAAQKEALVLGCLGIIALTFGDVSNIGTMRTVLATLSFCGIYVVATVLHELGHAIVLWSYDYQFEISVLQNPEVVATHVVRRHARIAALLGPLTGAASSLFLSVLCMRLLGLNAFYSIFGFIFFCSHVLMLLPVFSDGSILFNTVGSKEYA